jgi:hypothetical protein
MVGMRRPQLAKRVAELAGDGVLTLTEIGQGWPALGDLALNGNPVPVAVFVGNVRLSGRFRDDVERRFQNPGQGHPIVLPPNRLPLLLGLWEDDCLEQVTRPVIMAADVKRREGLQTRLQKTRWQREDRQRNHQNQEDEGCLVKRGGFKIRRVCYRTR